MLYSVSENQVSPDAESQPISVVPLLKSLVASGGSDLHCKVGSPPRVRIDGRLRRLKFPDLRPEDTHAIFEEVVRPDLIDSFAREHEADFAMSLSGIGRFRVNAYQARNTIGLVFRHVAAQRSEERRGGEVVGW